MVDRINFNKNGVLRMPPFKSGEAYDWKGRIPRGSDRDKFPVIGFPLYDENASYANSPGVIAFPKSLANKGRVIRVPPKVAIVDIVGDENATTLVINALRKDCEDAGVFVTTNTGDIVGPTLTTLDPITEFISTDFPPRLPDSDDPDDNFKPWRRIVNTFAYTPFTIDYSRYVGTEYLVVQAFVAVYSDPELEDEGDRTSTIADPFFGVQNSQYILADSYASSKLDHDNNVIFDKITKNTKTWSAKVIADTNLNSRIYNSTNFKRHRLCGMIIKENAGSFDPSDTGYSEAYRDFRAEVVEANAEQLIEVISGAENSSTFSFDQDIGGNVPGDYITTLIAQVREFYSL